MMKKRVTNIGGIFFKAENPKEMNDWYRQCLGIDIQDWGALFKYRDFENPESERYNVFSIFSQRSDYFKPSDSNFMINFVVENLNELLVELKTKGVSVIGEIKEDEFGKFAWVVDPEGNKIELWEPPK
jgi:predicted enzyme related to lactoylglutathione lyase